MVRIDTTDCENEPIRFPGAVMPHGALLVLSANRGTIEAVSESCADLLGLGPDRLIGGRLEDVIGAAAADLPATPSLGVRPLFAFSAGGRALTARLHDNESGQILVDIEPEGAAPAVHADMLYAIRRGIEALRSLGDLEAIFEAAAEWIRDVTGYDRVMVYRFDAAWNGAVVGEARSADLKRYRGHNFPVSDIPKQARELSKRSGPRMIVDADYTPSPLVGAGEPRSIDLGASSLRSVSPIHIQFLKNMGVRATLVGSLVVDGRLWGHLSCHHERGPKYLGPAARDAFQWACEDVAALIGATETRKLRERERELAALRQKLVQTIRSTDFEALMLGGDASDLLAVVGADGFALADGHQVQTCGVTPSKDAVRRLLGLSRAGASDPTFFASSALARDLGDGAGADGIAGALLVSAPEIPEVALAWFRRERRYDVRWAGDPDTPHLTGDDGRLTPRTSFDLFLQEIAGTSLEWTPEEQASAKELASLVEIELLRKEAASGKIRERKLRDSEERFRLLVEEAPDAIVIVDFDRRRLLAANRAAERLLGASRDEILERHPRDFLAPEQPDGRSLTESLPENAERALAGEEVSIERRIRRPSGEERLCRVTLVRLPSDVRLLRASLIDITEQDRTGRELASTAAILAAVHESSPDGILVVDPTGRILLVNRRFREIFEAPAEMIAVGMVAPQVAFARDRVIDPEAFVRRVRRLYDHPDESARDEVLLTNGRVIDRFTSPFRAPDGERLGRIWYLRDITESRTAEEMLRASEERFRMLVEDAPDAILICDLDQDRLVGANKAAERLLGVPRSEILKHGPQAFYAPDQPDGRPVAESIFEHNERALAGEEVTYERRIRRPSGEERVCRATVVRLPSSSRLLRGSFVDITEQDRIRRELASTAAILAAEHESSPDGILVVDPSRRILSVNRRFAEIFDIPREQFDAPDLEPMLVLARRRILDPEALERRVKHLYDHPEECGHDELALSDGRIVDQLTSPFTTSDGEYLGRIWFFRDITERRKAEESLRASEERFRTLVEEAPDAILIYDLDQDRVIGANKAAERLFGVPRGEILKHGPQDFYAPDQPDQRPVAESFSSHNEQALAGHEVTYERRIRRPSGEERVCRVTLVRLLSSGRLLRGSFVDITEQHRAQRELASAAAILATVHDSSPDGILVVDPAGRILSVNRRVHEMFDIPAEVLERGGYGPVLELARRRVLDREALDRLLRYLNAHPDDSAHDEVALKDGRVLDQFTAPFKTPDGETLGRIWFFRDVTERRRAEDSLRASEERFRLLVEEGPDAILLYNIDQNRIIAANKAAESLFDVSRDEILTRELWDYFAPEQPDGLPFTLSFSVKGGPALVGEEMIYKRVIRRPSGEERLCRATLIRLPSSVPLLRASLVDITEEDRAQRELASTAAILATEHESSPDGILVVDPEGRILSHNRRFREMFDIPPEILASREPTPALQLALQQVTDADAFLAQVRYLYDHPDASARDELLHKDGRAFDRRTSPFKTADGKTLGRIWFFRDVTERRNAEETLRASEERFRTLVEEAPDAILLYDVDRDRLIDANKGAERLFGVSRDEILRRGTRSFYLAEQPDGKPLDQSFLEHNRRALAGEEVNFERRISRASGEERLCHATLVRLPSNIRLLRASLVDITEQRAAEAQLSEVLRGALVLQEADRQRIARELHDSLSQYLAVLNMKLEMFGRSTPDALTSGIVELKGLTASIGEEVSRLAWELRPIALDDIGLEPAIRSLVDQWAKRSELRFDLLINLNGRSLSRAVDTALYRVLQEAITNIVKHAAAGRVGVILKTTPDSVVMIIEDDGKGFEPEAVNRGSSPRLGLLGMRERLALVHGALEIETGHGAGTTLIVRAPLDGSGRP